MRHLLIVSLMGIVFNCIPITSYADSWKNESGKSQQRSEKWQEERSKWDEKRWDEANKAHKKGRKRAEKAWEKQRKQEDTYWKERGKWLERGHLRDYGYHERYDSPRLLDPLTYPPQHYYYLHNAPPPQPIPNHRYHFYRNDFR